MREVLGYSLAVMAVLIAFGGVWAARHYSPRRKYARMRAQERRAGRGRTKIGEVTDNGMQLTPEYEADVGLNSHALYQETPGQVQTGRVGVDAVHELVCPLEFEQMPGVCR
jgi:hypothetical protein